MCNTLDSLNNVQPQYGTTNDAYTPVLKADSGATSNYIRVKDSKYISDITRFNGPLVYQPDKTTLKISQRGSLNLSNKLTTANKANILPGLTNSSLLSVGTLCNDGCIAIFTKDHFFVLKNLQLILKGTRNWTDGLWDVPFPHQSPTTNQPPKNVESINYIIKKDQPKYHLAAYIHACMFSPTISTLQRAVNLGNLISFPNIDNINFKTSLGPTAAMAKGHLDQEYSGLQTTKQSLQLASDLYPQSEIKCNEAIFSLFYATDINKKSYLDITGKFPHASSRGNKYLLVIYDHDSNIILAHVLKTRQAAEITAAWKKLYDTITQHGHTTKYWIMDNEASAHLKNALTKNDQTFQLTPPHMHRINAAERAILTYKNHLLAGLATCDENFPINEWDRLIPAANITINLLRNSRINTK